MSNRNNNQTSSTMFFASSGQSITRRMGSDGRIIEEKEGFQIAPLESGSYALTDRKVRRVRQGDRILSQHIDKDEHRILRPDQIFGTAQNRLTNNGLQRLTDNQLRLLHPTVHGNEENPDLFRRMMNVIHRAHDEQRLLTPEEKEFVDDAENTLSMSLEFH